jgi:hypothetical protein
MKKFFKRSGTKIESRKFRKNSAVIALVVLTWHTVYPCTPLATPSTLTNLQVIDYVFVYPYLPRPGIAVSRINHTETELTTRGQVAYTAEHPARISVDSNHTVYLSQTKPTLKADAPIDDRIAEVKKLATQILTTETFGIHIPSMPVPESVRITNFQYATSKLVSIPKH